MSTIPSEITTDTTADAWLTIVKSKLDSIRFGSVQIVIHEGRVTHIDSTEKTRILANALDQAVEQANRRASRKTSTIRPLSSSSGAETSKEDEPKAKGKSAA